MGPSGSNVYQGIDVSEWQGNIDYSGVASDNIQVVYIKASEGSQYKDSQFEANYANAKARGLKVGFYHYVTATTTDQAVQQANFFVSVIAGKEPDCKLAMDFEQFGDLSVAQINNIALTFIQTVEQVSGQKAIVYSDLYNTQAVFNSSLAPYPLWVAEYGALTPGNSNVWPAWVGFQYSDTGEISGISGNVDLDKFTDGVLVANQGPIQKVNPPPSLNPGENISYYTVKSGDTLSAIAGNYHTTVSCIVSLNNISNSNIIYVGQTLKIYTIQKPAPKISSKPVQKAAAYIVVNGDTLSGIAARFNTTVASLAALNNIQNPNLIYVGQTLKLSGSSGTPSSTNAAYTIVYEDTLSGIAMKFHTTVANLAAINHIQNPDLIYAGQVITI